MKLRIFEHTSASIDHGYTGWLRRSGDRLGIGEYIDMIGRLEDEKDVVSNSNKTVVKRVRGQPR
jgi:hypothetical protein